MANLPVDRGVFLRILAKRIIVSPDGEIFDHELHSPFEYLNSLVDKVESADHKPNGRGSEHVLLGPPRWKYVANRIDTSKGDERE
jgi:hypothetical protein